MFRRKAPATGCILKDVPGVSAVPSALTAQIPGCDQEGVLLLRLDAVLDGDQYDRDRLPRRWPRPVQPVHGGREIHARSGLELNARSRTKKCAGGRDEMSLRQAEGRGKLPPKSAAGSHRSAIRN